MVFREIIYKKEDAISWITINREDKMNSFTSRTIKEMTEALRGAERDPEIRVVVITGAGNRAFCSGGDVDEFQSLFENPGKARLYLRKMTELQRQIKRIGKPVIAAVNGICVGGGHEIHLWCDITIASENAKFGQVGPRVGSVPMFGGTQWLHRNVGEKRARYQIFTTDLWTAKEAEEIGLVNKVVPAGNLKEAVIKVARKIMEQSPQCIRAAKAWLNIESDMFEFSYNLAEEMLPYIWNTAESKEGAKAFLEKRKPDWIPKDSKNKEKK